ncbi:WD40 repeat-like protein [Linderina pennispora]|uniref:WD40 repeat-like protein n=1 Tax=Linderina pennispora TaxID=61395 RepID=A0A1Y1WJJ5_9FUNG|nr:WD40 repeat-like protein [Linderina pennispora]ORX73751.1 WD40 repeat-like protein [Linderina pennispora]
MSTGAMSPRPVAQQRLVPEFTTTETVIFDFAPKEKVAYNKETQTSEAVAEDTGLIAEEEVERRDEKARQEREEERMRREAEAKAKENEIRRLTEEQRAGILQSTEFAGFVDTMSRVMERALDEDYDVMLAIAFSDDRVSRGRSVMDVAWSGRFTELVAAAYNRNPMAPNEPDGVVAIWNTHLKERPEFVFHAPSDVLKVTFSDFNPNIIVGGAYSGQILLWDTRARSQPVLKTPLTSGGHTHPVYALKLISASTDGLVCSWQLDMLAQPQETLELAHPAHLRTDEVSTTKPAAFVAGTAEGVAYQVNRYDRAGSKAGLAGFDAYRAHTAPLTSLSFHPADRPASTVPTDIRPVHVFDAFDDYVCDAKWSPSHPSCLPVQTVNVGRALNRLAWDRPGKRVATGGADGTVYVYDVGDLATPKPDDSAKFSRVISSLSS